MRNVEWRIPQMRFKELFFEFFVLLLHFSTISPRIILEMLSEYALQYLRLLKKYAEEIS